MFIPNTENLKRFRHVNDHLLNLTDRADDRLAEINAVEYYMASPEDDDEVIESWVRFVYYDENSILQLEDDEYYGSNFPLMIKTLYELYLAKGHEKIVHLRNRQPPLEVGDSWKHTPFWKWKDSFNDIIICYAVHDLTSHKAYSVPDLLRLNSFLCESSITFQSITRQDGTQFKPKGQALSVEFFYKVKSIIFANIIKPDKQKIYYVRPYYRNYNLSHCSPKRI